MPASMRPVRDLPPRLVVAGGGVGGLEAALALRALAGDRPAIDLVSPDDAVVYRAVTVAEPFGLAEPLRIGFERLERAQRVRHVRDAVARVDTDARTIELRGGGRVEYDTLVVAVGARQEPWLDRAVTFGGRDAVPAMRKVLDRLAADDIDAVVFAAPHGASWTLPVYELALLTAAWCAERSLPAPRLHVAAFEDRPLGAFGGAAARLARELLLDRGISVHGGDGVVAYDGRTATLAGGGGIDADAVVALPRLRGNRIAGLPADDDGFIPVGEHGRVTGVQHVYAVGDATTHPVKQGGLAAQQADVAAAAIAHELGAAVDVPEYDPVMRGMLLTGVTSAFLRKGPDAPVAGFSALWWPPTKVAGRHLAGYLADARRVGEPEPLVDRAPAADLQRAARDRAEVRALAMEMASADAQWGDFDSAARWLQAVEWIDGKLPAELAARRDRWLEKAATGV